MNKDFTPYEPSLEMKSLGFNEPCLGAHGPWGFMPPNDVNSLSDDVRQEDLDNQWSEEDCVCLAPTFSQAFRWLLDKHHLYGIVIPTVTMDWTFKTMTIAQGMVEVPPYNHVDDCDYSSREEAELACLKKLIEIVK
jgi:hypothetical protein